MKMQPAGYSFLIQKYSLDVCCLLFESAMTDRSTKEVVVNGDFRRVLYPVSRYHFEDSWQAHITFALRYEGVNVEVLQALFNVLDPEEITAFIQSHPLGRAQRRVWLLYEYLTGHRLDLPDGEGGYLPLVDDKLQFALPERMSPRERRYHIVNNLIGNRQFSPLVRKTDKIAAGRYLDLKNEARNLLSHYSPGLIYRAEQYLFVKETKSSFAIERESPDRRRMDAFVGLLRSMSETPLTREALVAAQNGVVDARYRQQGWRSDQVYVGETITPGYEKVHYIAPRPDAISELMAGFLDCLGVWLADKDADPLVVAAVMGFAFVFLHPFDDGNGRVHRYLLHAILSQLDFIPKGLIFPVSTVMLKNQQAYDHALESFSRRLMDKLDYVVDGQGEVAVERDSRAYYAAIDFTPIVEYFIDVIGETIRTEWKAELDYLERYDQARRAMREIVDMPEKKANQFILYARQNGGRLSQRKRPLFPELTEEEIMDLENCLRRVGL